MITFAFSRSMNYYEKEEKSGQICNKTKDIVLKKNYQSVVKVMTRVLLQKHNKYLLQQYNLQSKKGNELILEHFDWFPQRNYEIYLSN